MTAKREQAPKLIDRGEWNDGKTTWEFWRSNKMPDPKLCSAVGLVAIMGLERRIEKSKIVLTRNNRGWEMIAGGIDPGETPDMARDREALEEGGFVVANPVVFGHRKIINKELTEEGRRKGYKPLAFMPYYFAYTNKPLRKPTGHEIIESQVVSMETAKERLKPGELLLIQEGLRAARLQREGAEND